MSADALTAAALNRLVAGLPHAGRVHVLHATTSTIDACRERADAGHAAGTVVVAHEQSAGRGQRGNRWFSPRGRGLYLSVLARPRLEPEALPVLTALAGVALLEALRALGVPAVLKRPNDLLVEAGGRWAKLGGVHVDSAVQGRTVRHAILSAGVNVSLAHEELPDDLRGIATSIHAATRVRCGRADVARAFLERLHVLGAGVEDAAGRARLVASHDDHARDLSAGQAVVAAGATP